MISVLKRIIQTKYFFTASFLIIGGVIWGTNPRVIQSKGPIFGTHYTVTVVASRLALSQRALDQLVQSELQRINAIFSTYSEHSDIITINQAKTTNPIAVSNELHVFFKRSMAWFHRLNGAWDPTMGRISQFYGLQPSIKPMNKNHALDNIGFNNLQILPNMLIQKKIDGLTFDFSSNAKGYAVDQVMDVILNHSVVGVFIDIGGEIRTHGHNGRGMTWRVGIQSPIFHSQPLAIIEGHDMAMASSGNYLNHADGVGHILDPRTGGPISHDLLAVTVMADTCFDADTIATGIFVMGKEEATSWLKQHTEYPAMLAIKEKDQGLMVLYFNGFEDKKIRMQ